MSQQIADSLRAAGAGATAARAFRGIMLPHAGWQFCAATMAKTLARVRIPQTVIILGPRHTPLGPPNSIASHAAWRIPGAEIPVDTSLARRLAAATGLACESEAHRQEHGTEVLLPFLHHLRPDLRIVPIVLGQCDAATIAGLAQALGRVSAEARGGGLEAPLLVISSDMNHFANEAETRRRDTLALAAMQTGDAQRLWDTCVENDISMCGLLPAVTVMQALRQATPALGPEIVDYTTSAAVSGDRDRVVGYAGVVIA